MSEKEEDRNKMFKLLITVGIIMTVTLLCTIFILKQNNEWTSLMWFLNGEKPFSVRVLVLSMVSGLVFGFIDNAGLFFGMDALDSYLPGGKLEKAGWGNTFSDGIGAFMGAFVAKMISIATGFDGNGPIYGDCIGIIIGCILGIYIPKMITGKS